MESSKYAQALRPALRENPCHREEAKGDIQEEEIGIIW